MAIAAGVHRNFLLVVVRRNFLLVVVHRNFPLAVHRNFLLVVQQVEAARKNNSTAACPAVRILVDLACLVPAEVVRS
jgi:hypothetical protein